MNLPDRLTAFRIILIPIFMLVLTLDFPTGSFNFANVNTPSSQVLAVVIFAGAPYISHLDGHTARTRELVINFGKFADSPADKMLVITVFVFLVSVGKTPAWIVTIIACREPVVTGLCLVLIENDDEVLTAKMPGGIKTATQILSIIFLLLGDIFFIGAISLHICLILTVRSGWGYFYRFKDVFTGEL